MTPKFLVIDLFCGAGGTTTGFALANANGQSLAKVIACVNHDAKAIESHWKNHPDVVHFEEDIRTLDLSKLVKVAERWKKRYPKALLVLWASLECTNFSKAKGGLPRDADSRTLAIHLERYIDALQPDYVKIENVVEFMAWGPMRIKVKKNHETYTELSTIRNKAGQLVYGYEPLSKKNGQDWMKWRNEICARGYYDDWKELNSANYGAYTSRNRLFGVFARPGLPITWPEPTHAKKAAKSSLYGGLKPWKPVKDVLDFSDEGTSIFDRDKPLSDRTLERIYHGLIKYVAGENHKAFISKYYSGKPSGKNISVEGPAGTITCVDSQALVQAVAAPVRFLVKYNSMGLNGHYTAPSVDEPCPALTTQGRLAVASPDFLALNYTKGGNLSAIDGPCPTLTTKDRVSIVRPKFFIEKGIGKGQNQSVLEPAGTIMPNDKHRIINVEPFLVSQNYGNGPTSVQYPAPTITANRKYHYIVNPSHGGNVSSVDLPCPVLIARQDKAPLSLVDVESGNVVMPVYDNDTEIAIRIKEFMVLYNLKDIKMRMLRINEQIKIQGFPENYVLVGTQADQKKFIGNSVVPLVVKSWVEALANNLTPELLRNYKKQQSIILKAA